MTGLALSRLLGSGDWLANTINYEIIKGNAIWRFVVVLLVVLVAVAAGRIAQYFITSVADRREKKRGINVVTLFLNCLSKPISVAVFALGLFVCRALLVFGDAGINPSIGIYWIKIAQAVAAIAFAYALYRLVDIIEYYLQLWTGKTKTKLDDMLVPVIRKSLRITIAIIAVLWIADGILEAEIRTILLSAGVGGVAIALAAKDTIANFFGSITIFADRPFQIDELVKIGEHFGPVEDVGFRSTRVRTLHGHLVTVPNSVIANSIVENVGRRPFIRRTSNITITYGSGHSKAKRAVEIIKEVLTNVPEVNTDPQKPPRVYFSDFNDWSLNIYMSYWVKPPDYWVYHEVNERVNLEIMKRFEAEQIEFAFPSQTLYVKKD
ncbi:MAG: mechanosensitive ion channel family protein [Planctomycetota bacterium]|nr:MAG: mechanosensitive ion channel family protein [Planctomycetota bacterium]